MDEQQRGRLVLGRRQGESISLFVGDEAITITLQECTMGRAKVAIEATRKVKIMRHELLDPVTGLPRREREERTK
jgi:sRNA-binding carbon storage regulator CsrA